MWLMLNTCFSSRNLEFCKQRVPIWLDPDKNIVQWVSNQVPYAKTSHTCCCIFIAGGRQLMGWTGHKEHCPCIPLDPTCTFSSYDTVLCDCTTMINLNHEYNCMLILVFLFSDFFVGFSCSVPLGSLKVLFSFLTILFSRLSYLAP